MATLTNFDLVHTTGLRGLHYKGDFIPFEKIDDALAEQLDGKTHVLKRRPAPELAPAPPVPELAAAPPVAELAPAAEAEAPAAPRKRGTGN